MFVIEDDVPLPDSKPIAVVTDEFKWPFPSYAASVIKSIKPTPKCLVHPSNFDMTKDDDEDDT